MILSLGDALSGLPSPSPRYSDWDCHQTNSTHGPVPIIDFDGSAVTRRDAADQCSPSVSVTLLSVVWPTHDNHEATH